MYPNPPDSLDFSDSSDSLGPSTAPLTAQVPSEYAGKRLDQVLALLFPNYSRSRLQQWIKQDQVRVNGMAWAAKDRLFGGEHLTVKALTEIVTVCAPQDLPLTVVYEDEDLLVINKPAGLVVHPGAGNAEGTLQNALLHYDQQLEQLPRAGIVHRLDKETSGLLVVARSLSAHTSLVRQLQERQVKREYDAIVVGELIAGGTVDKPIGRHPLQRTQMAVRVDGKPAITHYTLHQRFAGYTWLKVALETGRTHQIRVHLTSINYPLIGDPVYGPRHKVSPHTPPDLKSAIQDFPRQALHASRLGLKHPQTQQLCQWQIPLAADMQDLLAVLQTTLSH